VSTHPSQPANPTSPSNTPTPGTGRQLEVGQTIGKYRIVRHVGVGGMAQVFLASREGPEGFAKPYVIKRILPELSRDEQFAKLFVIEAKVAAMLDHPNIVHVFDFEIENGNYYLVMEYVAGASLAHLLRANRRRGVALDPPIVVEIGVAVAHALAYAHDLTLPDGTPLDLVHRDISPGNVLISRDGAVKLADFGVVKTSVTTTVVGVVNGKWAYMSPEQISGQAVDHRSDLFSLGIVLYEALTGLRLFRGESAAATASRVMEAKIRRPKAVVPDLDPRLDHIVMQMLERNPQARYQTAAALAADLEALRTTPVFSSGAFQLRNVVRVLLPETSTPALGTSFSDAAGSGAPGSSQGQHLGTMTDDREVSFQVPAAASPFEPGVSWRLVAAIAAGCLFGSLIFWFFVL
jgi:eukaryotic-like serine/threonine-protein kinase